MGTGVCDEAVSRRAGVGPAPSDRDRFRSVTFEVRNLPDDSLDTAAPSGDRIAPDADPAGSGQFVALPPADDREFGLPSAARPAAGRTDLPTVNLPKPVHGSG